MTADPSDDPACDVAHGVPPASGDAPTGTVAAVFASPVAAHLLHFARHLGWRCVLLEPDPARVDDSLRTACDVVLDDAEGAGRQVLADADVVVTDHDRPELGPVLRDALLGPARWVGVMGSPRHAPPHVPALQALGVANDEIARVHRPIGLDIGSRTPPEIALSTMAGLLADRRGRSGTR